MLVGAGEIDAALLVVAADDGPRAQTLEHLALLDALGIAPRDRGRDEGRRRSMPARVDGGRAATSTGSWPGRRSPARRSSPSRRSTAPGSTRSGPPSTALRDRVVGRRATGGRRAVAPRDRSGLRGQGSRRRRDRDAPRRPARARRDRCALVPGDGDGARPRDPGPRRDRRGRRRPAGPRSTSPASSAGELHRGLVLTDDPAVVGDVDRMLVRLSRAAAGPDAGAAPPRDGRGRCAPSAGAGATPSTCRTARSRRSSGSPTPIAVAPGDRFVLRRVGRRRPDRRRRSCSMSIPPRGVSRRRQTADRVAALAAAVDAGDAAGASRPPGSTSTGVLVDGGPRRPWPPTSRPRPRPRPRARSIPTATLPVAAGRGSARDPARGRPARGTTAADRRRAPRRRRSSDDGRLVRDGDRLRRPGAATTASGPGARRGDGPPRARAGRRRAAAPGRARPGPPAARRPASATSSGAAGSSSSSRISPTRRRPIATSRPRRSALRDADAPDPGRAIATRPGRAASTSWRSSRTSTGAGSCDAPPTATSRAPGRRRPPDRP